MFQQKRNIGLSADCIKLFFIVGGIIAGFFIFFTWVLIALYFSYEKKIRKINTLSLLDTLNIGGLTGCLNSFSNDIGTNKNKYKRSIEKFKKTIYNKTNKKKKSKNNYYYDNEKNASKLNNSLVIDSNTRSKNIYSEKRSILTKSNGLDKTYFSNKYSSFNNGKSIWDDYESVIDIMDKKK